MQRRSRTPSMKRKSSRSLSRKPKSARALKMPTRTLALAAPSVGLGLSATTVLRTSFFVNNTAAATGIFTGYLKPGSCFDPCGDLAAIQPQMFDQFAAQYNRYKVNSATIRIKITGSRGSSPGVWVCAAYPSIDPTPLGTYQAAASQQYAKTTSGGFQELTAVGVGTEGKYLSFNLKHDQVVGAKSDAWDIGGLVTADPTALQYMVLPIYWQSAAAAADRCVFEIDIFQNVTFSQKKNTVDA